MLPSKVLDEQDNQTITNPVCPQCGGARECILEQIPSPASYVLSIVSVFYFGIWSIFIIPLIFQSTKVIVKKCYFCNTEIEKLNLFSGPSLSDKVLQFKCGTCIIVLSRKYALVLLILFISAFFYFEIIRETPKVEEVIQYSTVTWPMFLDQCGKFQLVDNGMRAHSHYYKYFHEKVVTWEGYFVQLRVNMDNSLPYSRWIYIKMDPTESAEDFPDIVIGVQKNMVKEVNNQLSDVKQGLDSLNQLNQAKFQNMGNDFNYHMLSLISMNIKQEFKGLHYIPKYMDLAHLQKENQQETQKDENKLEEIKNFSKDEKFKQENQEMDQKDQNQKSDKQQDEKQQEIIEQDETKGPQSQEADDTKQEVQADDKEQNKENEEEQIENKNVQLENEVNEKDLENDVEIEKVDQDQLNKVNEKDENEQNENNTQENEESSNAYIDKQEESFNKKQSEEKSEHPDQQREEEQVAQEKDDIDDVIDDLEKENQFDDQDDQ